MYKFTIPHNGQHIVFLCKAWLYICNSVPRANSYALYYSNMSYWFSWPIRCQTVRSWHRFKLLVQQQKSILN